MADNKNQYKFSEGEIHPFTITGYTEIPGTDESFFILKNSFGGKHLLKAIHYLHFNLQLNQTINCKIDKINCSGKIYLEPENPIYKEGGSYDFEIVKITEQINSVGEKEQVAIVKDQLGMSTACSLPKDFKIDLHISSLTCKVLRIKKGQLFLMLPESKESILNIGKKYWFTVSEIKKLANQVDHYILKDEFKGIYSLKKDMYKHYSFKMNQKVECLVTKYGQDGHLKIEPEHPHYEIGKIYSFKYLKTLIESDPLRNEEKVIVVEDIYGVETKVRSNVSLINTETFPEFLNCKVEGIRKGKAILSIK